MHKKNQAQSKELLLNPCSPGLNKTSRTYLPKDEPLNHLTKNRVSVPNRRKPSRFESNQKFATNGDNRRRSDSTDYVNQYLDNDKPVMV